MVELLVAMSAGLALMAPLTGLIVAVQDGATGSTSRADSIVVASGGLREMDQELRQAYAVEFPTSTVNAGCPESSGGVQPCNVADVLERLAFSGFSGADFEVRYDCSVASATIAGDRACWRYLCSASAATGSGAACTASSSTLLSSRLVIDDLVNGTSADPVFSFCYPSSSGSACATGAARPTSATVTIKTPATGVLPTRSGGDPSTITLTDGLYFANLDFNQ